MTTPRELPHYTLDDHRLFDDHYGKVADASREAFEFDLGPCSFRFDFSRIWP